MHTDPAHLITDADALQALYGSPGEASLKKEVDHVHPHYRAFIEAAPFALLATAGPDGLDASPRGDPAGFVAVEDEKTLLLPDRRGNNRVDSLLNVIADPRVALLFLIPGSGTTFRINGRAGISVDPALLDSFAVDGKAPRTAVVVTVETAYFQCARAIVRSHLWDPARHVDPKALPTPGQILAALNDQGVGGEAYDREWPERAAKSLW